MDPSIEALLKDYEFRPDLLQRVAFRTAAPAMELVSPDPTWPAAFELIRTRIAAALSGPNAQGEAGFLAIHHSGSTSVPGLPAKDTIDIDLVVPFITDESTYIPQLEAAGFHFTTREPRWHEHRFLYTYDPRPVNLHVWGPNCPEVERHRIFKEWLLTHEEDRRLYVQIKEEAMRATNEDGGGVMDYNKRKENMIREILRRAFIDLGYIKA